MVVRITERVTNKKEKTTFFTHYIFRFCLISPSIFGLEKATIHQIDANVMRIPQILTVFDSSFGTGAISLEAGPLYFGTRTPYNYVHSL